ncbi:hypothetical protein WJX72_006801 [[Myrmecia] bisecta]|uniref:Helicase ATP-binding domain-containing protein n=1 Tax=[Myrmecia] bisecta TaxID=41462 RepID=A0AAW1PWJ0_9CHLO
MTYGFFRAVSTDDTHFSKWGAVILDEAHERRMDADALLPQLSAACQARADFKAIVMSATIDVSVFATSLEANGMPPPCPVIEVPGVTYPVQDVWWGGEPWVPTADGAITNLAMETVRVFNDEDQGNLLVFLGTIAAVNEMVSEVSRLLQHDKVVTVRPLYAALSDVEKEEVTAFSDLAKYPRNKGKRLICISINVAEAGVTIPGITAVIETSWEMDVSYDHVLKGKEQFAAESGDHETLLAIYTAWVGAHKSSSWSAENGIKPGVLAAADQLLGKLDKNAIALLLTDGWIRKLETEIEARLGMAAQLRLVKKAKTLTVTVLAVALDAAVDMVHRRLGSPNPSGLVSSGTASLDAHSGTQHLTALQTAPAEQIKGQFGSGQAGSLMLLARLILTSTPMWVYGGFLRDLVLRGETHANMDLDVGLPKEGGMTIEAGLAAIVKQAQAHGMAFLRQSCSDPRVCACWFSTLDRSSEVEVQIVDAYAFAQKDARVDFDVNNLKLASDGSLQIKSGAMPAATNLNQIIANVQAKRLLVCKPAREVTDRIKKMRERGWQITYPC